MTHPTLPVEGLLDDALFGRLEEYRAGDMPWRDGRTFAYIYDAGRKAEDVAKEAYRRFLGENALDPTVFPSLLRLETELVGIGLGHLGAPDTAAGSFTSGGTESIMLAVKAARDHARATRPDLGVPEIVLPTTAHAAFHKSAHYLGMRVRPVDVDPTTFRVEASAMAAAITNDTVLLVASAPQYAHGVIDPIAAIGALAQERGLLFHVDACVGGWLLPFWRRLGVEVPAFDFNVPGVTSISMDLHKYAFAPKGASLVLYRDAAMRRFQMFACSEWTGYTVINPTVQSSKGGGSLAGAWAVLHHLGDAGYLELARRTLEGTRELLAGIESIQGLRVLGDPDFCLVAAASDGDLGIFHVIDEMKDRGWYVQPQLSFGGSPANVHFSLHPGNAHQVAPMLEDLSSAVDAAAQLPAGQLAAALGDQLGALDVSSLDSAMFGRLLGMAGISGVALPERMAPINEILDILPRALTRELLVEFINQLYVYAPAPGAPGADGDGRT